MPTAITGAGADRDLQQWLRAIEQLLEQVKAWSRTRKWPVECGQKETRESRLGAYTVPILHILSPGGIVCVEPIARDVVNAQGRVDLYAFPSLNRMILVRDASQWVLKTDAGVRWPEKWSQRTFVRLVERLTEIP